MRRPAAMGLIVALAVAGCGSTPTGDRDPVVTSSATPVAEDSTAVAAPSDAPPSTIPVGTPTVGGPGTFDLLDARIALDDLAAYRSTLQTSFDGTRDGTPERWSTITTLAHDQANGVTVVTTEATGAIDPLDITLEAEQGDLAYIAGPGVTCVSRPIPGGVRLRARAEPARLLSGMLGAEAVGEEMIDGMAAAHYAFDARALPIGDAADASGDIWVADAGRGPVLRYALAIVGGEGYFGAGRQGTITFDYTLLTVAPTPTVPDDCPRPLDAPFLPGATEVVQGPGVLTFETTGSLQSVADFYADTATDEGWRVVTAPYVGEDDLAAAFEIGEATVRLVATRRDGVTSVLLGTDGE